MTYSFVKLSGYDCRKLDNASYMYFCSVLNLKHQLRLSTEVHRAETQRGRHTSLAIVPNSIFDNTNVSIICGGS